MPDLRLGLLGWPLSRSLSPLIHEAYLKSAGLGGSYSLLPVRPEDLSLVMGRLRSEGWDGLNVTFPFKSAAARLCIRIDADAESVDAVNTLVPVPGGWSGLNTDIGGFESSFQASGFEPPLLVAGSGGAGRAVARAAEILHIDAALFNRGGRHGCRDLSLLDQAIRDTGRGTLVNATTLGWADDDPFPARPDLPETFSFFDLNYNPGWRFTKELRRMGRRVVTGEAMLVSQAALSFRAWTGVGASEQAGMDALGRKVEA